MRKNQSLPRIAAIASATMTPLSDQCQDPTEPSGWAPGKRVWTIALALAKDETRRLCLNGKNTKCLNGLGTLLLLGALAFYRVLPNGFQKGFKGARIFPVDAKEMGGAADDYIPEFVSPGWSI